MLTGGFYEPILPLLPDHDKIGQIRYLSEFLERHFGVRPRGLWLAERVWEPHLPRALSEAGVEFVLLDDRHFALAGLDTDALAGYYLTEEQGARIAVFPISERLRYLVPFAEPGATLEYLRSWHGRGAGLTLVDDGEKFGLWPGTYKHVYEDGWLDRFFEALAGADWLHTTTFADFLDSRPATGAVYLPTASYTEMGLWALPTPAGLMLEDARARLATIPDGSRLGAWLRGGFWRVFLVKYPEVGDLYWKMLRLSRVIDEGLATRPDEPDLREARLALWRGQANDAYWHGVFGGCYLPHLRRAVKSALLTADRLALRATTAARASVSCEDANGDGRLEVLIRTPELALTLLPEQGGTLSEIGYLPRALDVADVLARRPEVYHRQLREPVESGEGVRTIHEARPAGQPGLESLIRYDRFRRVSLLDGLFAAEGALDPVDPWALAQVAFGGFRMTSRIESTWPHPSVSMSLDNPDGYHGCIQKTVSVRGARIDVRYQVGWSGAAPLHGRWAVQWNLALTAGDAPGRYLRLPGTPGLGSRGERPGSRAVVLVDEWIGVELRMQWSRSAHLSWGPIETVSISEAGFERIYQGIALLLAWPVTIPPGQDWDEQVSLDFADPRAAE